MRHCVLCYRLQLTTLHQQSTTNPPSKVLSPRFCQTPSKNGADPRPKKLLQKRSFFGLGLGFFRRDNDGGRYFVLVFEVEELDGLRAAA